MLVGLGETHTAQDANAADLRLNLALKGGYIQFWHSVL